MGDEADYLSERDTYEVEKYILENERKLRARNKEYMEKYQYGVMIAYEKNTSTVAFLSAPPEKFKKRLRDLGFGYVEALGCWVAYGIDSHNKAVNYFKRQSGVRLSTTKL